MSTLIFWFSGTGNSLHAARTIANGLTDDTRVVAIATALENRDFVVPAGSRLGFVFPVYALGPPQVVRKFISKLKADDVSSVFAVATYAGALGSAMAILEQQLTRRRLPLNNTYAIKMPENYPPMGGPPQEPKKTQILDQAERKIKAITNSLNRREPACREKNNPLLGMLGKAVNPLFKKRVGQADEKFYVDEKCDGDGTCEKVCPVANIKMVNGRPTWLGHCEQCFACLHWCPQSALQYGRRSRRQSRYHHPAVSLEDFTIQIQNGKTH